MVVYAAAAKSGFELMKGFLNKFWADKNVKIENETDRIKIMKDFEKFVVENDTEFYAIVGDISKVYLENEGKAIDHRGNIVLAEAKSESAFISHLRPAAGWLCLSIIAFKYVVLAISGILVMNQVEVYMSNYELPHEIWVTIDIILGGYIFSRGSEKVVQTYLQTKAMQSK